MRFFLIFLFGFNLLVAQNSIVKIGVLAKRGAAVTYKKWDHTAHYLSQKIPGKKFQIVPIDFKDIFNYVKEKKVDFILANSGFYVELEYKYGAQRITTLINKHISGLTQKEFGGVILTHRDNSKRFNRIEDLEGVTFAAVNEKSLGGWQMAWRELVEHGIEREDLKKLVFKGTHDNVVYAVLNKEVDAGTVRTDTLERMALESKIDLGQFHIIDRRHYEDFPFMISTKLYPEWPLAKLKHTSDELSKAVAVALMQMRSESKAALTAHIEGWGTPLSYQPVHDCFKILQIPPYFHKIEFWEVVQKYWHWILFYMILAIGGISMFIYQLRLTNHLKATQNELVQTEKMAALGRLVAGISHEINTPIGIGVTAASHLKKETEQFNRNYKEDNITKSSFEAFIDTSLQSSEMILHNLDRAAQLIKSFKQISVDQSSDEVREFNIKEYLESVVTSLKPTLKKTSHSIDIHCNETITIESNPGVFYQIFSNLIMNSLIHGFEDIEKGHILIEVKASPDALTIIYQDDGNGLSKENLAKLFDPFYTTKRGSGGSGLGTHIVYNLVTQKLHGTIAADSEVGKGLTYILHFKGVKYV